MQILMKTTQTSRPKKQWSKPEIYLLDSNDIQKNTRAFHESTLVPGTYRGAPFLFTAKGLNGVNANNYPFNLFQSHS